MANYTRLEYTRTVVHYELLSPTNAVELGKMLHAATQELTAYLATLSPRRGELMANLSLPDDALTVEASDERIVISWEKSR